MSSIRITYLYCDGGEECPKELEPFRNDPIPGASAADGRAEAKLSGWTCRKGKDYCPDCTQRLAARKKEGEPS